MILPTKPDTDDRRTCEQCANLRGGRMSQVKPDCYCLGGNRAHYSEAKYQSLQRTYEQARDEAKHLYGECLMLADVLRDAFEVVKTIEGEDSDECDKLQGLRMSIEYALAAYDERQAPLVPHVQQVKQVQEALL